MPDKKSRARDDQPDAGGPGRTIGLVAVVLAVVVGTVVFFYNSGSQDQPGEDSGGGTTSADADAQRRLVLAQTALSETENLDAASADTSWQSLFAELPKNHSVALNRALNRVLVVDELTGRVTNASLDEAAQKQARSVLPDAIDAARSAITDYSQLSPDDVMSLWLESRIALHEASLLPATLTKSLRQTAFQRLADAAAGPLGDSPKGIVLGGPLTRVLDEMEDPLDGLPPAIRDQAAETLATFSDFNPDNIFIARYAARLNIQAKQKRATNLVRRTSSLAQSIEPSLRRLTGPIGLTPDELVEQIIKSIDEDQWQTAESRMLLWFNVLNATEIVKTDRRRASPHPLDRLSFDCIRELSAAVAKTIPVTTGQAPLKFNRILMDSITDAAAVTTVDFDLDLDSDLAVLHSDGTLRLIRNPQSTSNDSVAPWLSSGTLKLATVPIGVVFSDLFMVDSSAPGRVKASRAAAPGAAQDYTSASRHDTFPTAIAYGPAGLQLIAVDGRRTTDDAQRLVLVDDATGLEDVAGATNVLTGDLEGDGDLDLIVATINDGVRLFVNRGNRTFFEVPGGGLKLTDSDNQPIDDPVTAMAIADIDRDLDLDIVTIHGQSGQVAMIENLLHLQFRISPLGDAPTAVGGNSVHVAEIDGNVSWDLIIGGTDGGHLVYSQTADAGAWTVDRTTQLPPSTTTLLADFDNDSWKELIDNKNATRLSSSKPSSVPITSEQVSGASLADDLTGDGLVDLAGVNDGVPFVLINKTADAGHYLSVRFKGIDDNNANSGRVNHYAIGSVLELRFGPHYRSEIITSPATHFGMDGFDQADSVRVILPNGLTQTIRQPTVDTIVEEEQTLKGSCPYLYTWDGDRFTFVTDCLWAAPLGLQVASGVVAKDRPWEYLKVDGSFVKPRDGQYELRLTEELWEVAYFDHIALQAVDHPADVDIWTNEKVGPGHLAQQTIFAFNPDDRRPLTSAVDTRGSDVTAALAKIDQDFVQGFDRRLRQGLCPPHWIDLTFAQLPSGSRSAAAAKLLVLTGWILPTDTSLNIQIDQNPELPQIEFPSVWVPDSEAAGGWRRAIDFMGFPGGKTKTIVVDVSDIIDADDPRLRIRTSAQIYWDNAYLALDQDQTPPVVHDLELKTAEVGYRGFSRRAKPGVRQPETYDYGDVSVAPRWPPLAGLLTAPGPAKSLLDAWDDSMIVISGGDEIRLRFDVPEAELPDGWKRDFILHCVGWDKDADLNTLAGQKTGPLPFKSMSEYPPTIADADGAARTDKLNERHLGRSQSFRQFWYRPPMH